MPVPLNAFLEIVRTWLTKRLGFMVDDSIPVRWSKGSVSKTTPSDMDLVCTHPKSGPISFHLGKERRQVELSRNLVVECKGWFDFVPDSITLLNYLKHDTDLMGNGRVIPKHASRKKNDFTFGILKEEVYDKAKNEIFSSGDFQRVIVTPKIKMEHKKKNIKKRDLYDDFMKKGVVIIEINEIIQDLRDFVRDPSNKDMLRKNFILELIHLLDVYSEVAKNA